MADHKARAEELLAEALESRTGTEVEASRQNQAMVHAMLAVAEQLRVANVIAATGQFGSDPAGWPSEIREALGVS